jgi:outer membrane protein assembly factor BamB
VSWRATTGVGDPTEVLGVPSPILAGDLAIVVGRGTVDAIDIASGDTAWSVPRAVGPSAPAAVAGDTLVFVEGGGEGTTAATSATSASPTPAPPTPSASGASESPAASNGASTLVGMSLTSQRRAWAVPLTAVSHTGVLISGHAAIVGADDGTVTAVDLDGRSMWTQDIGDHVVAPMAAAGDDVLATVSPEARGTAALLALHMSDGSLAWRYEPATPGIDLGAASVGTDAAGRSVVYVTGLDASVRALDASDGAQLWATALYGPTPGAPPAISGDAIVVTDQSGIVYALDPATGAERWRFATNLAVEAAPVVTAGTVVQPSRDGSISAISLTSGHQVWHGAISDSRVLGLADGPGLIVASVTGTTPGVVGIANDAAGTLEDVVSPTSRDIAALLANWAGAAIPLTVLFFVLGRALAARFGPAEFAPPTGEDSVDPWEDDGGEP